jgi:hypothetical protein
LAAQITTASESRRTNFGTRSDTRILGTALLQPPAVRRGWLAPVSEARNLLPPIVSPDAGSYAERGDLGLRRANYPRRSLKCSVGNLWQW